MTFLKYTLIILLSTIFLLTLILAFKSRKPLSFIFFNAFVGTTLLLILYLTRKITGLIITLNPFTVISATVLGLPSVILTLLLNIFILM